MRPHITKQIVTAQPSLVFLILGWVLNLSLEQEPDSVARLARVTWKRGVTNHSFSFSPPTQIDSRSRVTTRSCRLRFRFS